MGDRIGKWLDFSFLTLIRLGAAVALLPLVFAVLRTQDHQGFRAVQAEVTGSAEQCRISERAASRIGKRSHWWDCKEAANLQRAFPSVDLEISSEPFIRYRFVLPRGELIETGEAAGLLDRADPTVGAIVPLLYSPADPKQVRTVLGLGQWAILAMIGLAGLGVATTGWRLRERRDEFAARLADWLEQEPDAADAFADDWPTDEHATKALPMRGSDGRHLGVG
jgi:hypothetical protein